MIGTIANTTTILVGSVIGSVLKKGINEKQQQALFTAMGLAATGLGINSIVQNMPKSSYPVLFIVSLALGSLIGTSLNLSEKFDSITNRFSSGGNLAKGLSTGVLLFCIGTLSILGPINSALNGDNTYLFTNATLDFVTSMALASTYGIGMALTAIVLFCWQGAIYLLAKLLGPFMTAEMMTELSLVGGFLIASSGISMLNIKDCKTMNMLPSLIIPILFCAVIRLF
ncbi:MAG: DUF554 domain-containing protein [Eubacteriales bacterium]|nr:DUF554 domain-containing protein [Eubacteriales bacterium]